MRDAILAYHLLVQLLQFDVLGKAEVGHGGLDASRFGRKAGKRNENLEGGAQYDQGCGQDSERRANCRYGIILREVVLCSCGKGDAEVKHARCASSGHFRRTTRPFCLPAV